MCERDFLDPVTSEASACGPNCICKEKSYLRDYDALCTKYGTTSIEAEKKGNNEFLAEYDKLLVEYGLMEAHFWCGECGRACTIKIMDFGIGPYEFWGATGVDIQNDVVSECCEAEVYTDPARTEPYTYNDWCDDNPEEDYWPEEPAEGAFEDRYPAVDQDY